MESLIAGETGRIASQLDSSRAHVGEGDICTAVEARDVGGVNNSCPCNAKLGVVARDWGVEGRESESIVFGKVGFLKTEDVDILDRVFNEGVDSVVTGSIFGAEGEAVNVVGDDAGSRAVDERKDDIN